MAQTSSSHKTSSPNEMSSPKRTPLYDLHKELGAKIVPFANYELPLCYKRGIMEEHLHVRQKVGLFDVSHMGQAFLASIKGDVKEAFEHLTPSRVKNLGFHQTRYMLLTNAKGGIIDDFMTTNDGDGLWLVVNAARKETDFTHITNQIEGLVCDVKEFALLALQGPLAKHILEDIVPSSSALGFMRCQKYQWKGEEIRITRCGYTGEDGFEISLAPHLAQDFASLLLASKEVAPIGLGARDSLRLEAGLCLYGHDIDETTTVLEASLGWTIPKARLQEGGFLGDKILQAQSVGGVEKQRVGITLKTKMPAREGALIHSKQGELIGHITTGGFSPSLQKPIAMGYLNRKHCALGTEIEVAVRQKIFVGRGVSPSLCPTSLLQKSKNK